MHYHVTARLRSGTAGDFRAALTDGTIASQRPDGAEIVASMERAVVQDDGVVEWSEVCYCSPPLAHERGTVYDRFFEDMAIEPIDTYRSYPGRRFLDWLDEIAGPAA